MVVIGLMLGCDSESPLAMADLQVDNTLSSLDAVSNGDVGLRVMTRNVYHGVDAEIFDVPTASNVDELLTKVGAVYQGYFARNFPARAEALAAEIESTRPHLIGLQEAVMVRTGPLFDPGPATNVELDYVQILIDALAERGLEYKVVVQSFGVDIELPSSLGFDVRHTDREVILKRSDPQSEFIRILDVQAGHFETNCQIPTQFDPITVLRGWAAVDVRVAGKAVRLVSTHLDGDCLPITSSIQEAQAAELLAGPGNTHLPLVFLGDFNSPADGTGTTYNTLLSENFVDVWDSSVQGSGFTCCQEDDLLNSGSILSSRIDYILFRGAMNVKEVVRVGTGSLDLGASDPNWASDHAGVYATLELERPASGSNAP